MSQKETINPEFEKVHQGTFLTNSSFCALICDIEDITGYAKQINKTLTQKQALKAYELARRRLTDSIIENQFWYSIEAIIDEAKRES